ncbi:MAG: flavin reductase [Ruminococcus sp.]|nr:flavin reductase [Ruminococcus sp.]
MAFREISVNELSFNPFEKIGRDWFLVTAGDKNGCNTMTAAWGFMGVMWGKNVFETVIRPSRYTFEFVEKNPLFTVSFFDEQHRDALKFCGSHSGRDCDKAFETGLTPFGTDGTTAFEEANMIFICRKLYCKDMDAAALIPEESGLFGSEAPHKEFIGEIVKVLVKD